MTDLVAFLAARLREDEAAVRAVEDHSEPWPGRWQMDEANFALRTHNGWSLARAVTVEEGFPPGVLAHIVRNDPARVLREVEARRKILDLHKPVRHKGRQMCDSCLGAVSFWPCPTLRALAAVYSDPPDYKEEWQ